MNETIEKISADELAYLERVIASVVSAEQAFTVARAAHHSFGVYLSERYKLGPVDSIQQDGKIVRVQPDEPKQSRSAATRKVNGAHHG